MSFDIPPADEAITSLLDIRAMRRALAGRAARVDPSLAELPHYDIDVEPSLVTRRPTAPEVAPRAASSATLDDLGWLDKQRPARRGDRPPVTFAESLAFELTRDSEETHLFVPITELPFEPPARKRALAKTSREVPAPRRTMTPTAVESPSGLRVRAAVAAARTPTRTPSPSQRGVVCTLDWDEHELSSSSVRLSDERRRSTLLHFVLAGLLVAFASAAFHHRAGLQVTLTSAAAAARHVLQP
jgi:hypothetical protein